MEYGLAFVTVIGMPNRSAYSIDCSRVRPHPRTGAIVSRSGASARVDTSNRTWSLPFPVQPWATASAPCSRAAATMCFTITGRLSDDTSGYLPSYLALAFSAGATKSRAYSSLQSTTIASTAPAARARSRIDSKSPPCPTSAARAITSTPSSSTIHRTATDVSNPPLYASTTRLAITHNPFLGLDSMLPASMHGARRPRSLPCQRQQPLRDARAACPLGGDDQD